MPFSASPLDEISRKVETWRFYSSYIEYIRTLLLRFRLGSLQRFASLDQKFDVRYNREGKGIPRGMSINDLT